MRQRGDEKSVGASGLVSVTTKNIFKSVHDSSIQYIGFENANRPMKYIVYEP